MRSASPSRATAPSTGSTPLADLASSPTELRAHCYTPAASALQSDIALCAPAHGAASRVDSPRGAARSACPSPRSCTPVSRSARAAPAHAGCAILSATAGDTGRATQQRWPPPEPGGSSSSSTSLDLFSILRRRHALFAGGWRQTQAVSGWLVVWLRRMSCPVVAIRSGARVGVVQTAPHHRGWLSRG